MTTQHHTQIVSKTQGRTRFKVPPKHRHHYEMERLVSSLQTHPELHSVDHNVQTGSILVYHNPEQDTFHEICQTLRDLGLVFTDITECVELIHVNDGESENASDFDSAIVDLNQQVLKITNGLVDLRYLLPAGLGALAVLQFLTYGWQFEIVPWFVLAYFAVDSFMKLNFPEDQEPATQR